MKWINEPKELNNNEKGSCKECITACIIDICSLKHPISCRTKSYPNSK